ncbi:MAG: hypothetical protein GY765_03835 [bacterium]|nr:hypothetical protein [bacterium]
MTDSNKNLFKKNVDVNEEDMLKKDEEPVIDNTDSPGSDNTDEVKKSKSRTFERWQRPGGFLKTP